MTEDITKIMNEIALNARIANEKLAIASSEEKNDALNIMAEEIENNAKHILSENKKDIQIAKS
ncbi:gamma-glutamyl-phosphate reductase, partial [Gammaproteobacteria bacterium]|nr:gamma-glutamyl-phosphate reductase [Gammaproteobacteria bacterium]